MEVPVTIPDTSSLPSRLDRTAVEVTALTAATSDAAYWRQRTVAERLECMEQLRQLNYGDVARGRLQRVLEVVQRPWG